MKETKTLRMSFVDEGGNPWSFSILNPRGDVSNTDAKKLADNITGNNLINGKVGHVKNYNGAVVVTRTESEL